MEDSKAISEALSRIHQVINSRSVNIVQSTDLSRSDRELLLRTNWLQEIIKGWYILTKPNVLPGDSSFWYANFWDFLSLYLQNRFGSEYCLSAENSIELHVNSTIIPPQVIVMTAHGGGSGSPLNLPFDTSVLAYFSPQGIPKEKAILKNLNVMTLPYALCKVSASFFKKSPQEAEIALNSIKDYSELSRIILENNFKSAGSRLIGAYNFLKNETAAKKIESDLSGAGMVVHAKNPFEKDLPMFMQEAKIEKSPYANRIFAMWNGFKKTVIENFPPPPTTKIDKKEYMHNVDDIYKQDAYNSLSIEGYQVTPNIIERVQNNNWNPDLNLEDATEKNALAARGYFEAFQLVKNSVEKVLDGKPPGKVLRDDLQLWYKALFKPSIDIGIIKSSQLVGYRNAQVFIRNSRHIPPPKDALFDSMEAFFTCIEHEENAAVRSVLGHYMFVFIHPYMDGNGRLGRFLMNVMLASGNYPWTVVRMENRNTYMTSLETAGTEKNIEPFTSFLSEEMKGSF